MFRPEPGVGPGIYAVLRKSVTGEGEWSEVIAFAFGQRFARQFCAVENERPIPREGEIVCAYYYVNLSRGAYSRGKYRGYEIPDMPDFKDGVRLLFVKPLPPPRAWGELREGERWTAATFRQRVDLCRLRGVSDPHALARVSWDELPVGTREWLVPRVLALKTAEVKV